MPKNIPISVFREFGKYKIGHKFYFGDKCLEVVDHRFFCQIEWCLGLLCKEVKNA